MIGDRRVILLTFAGRRDRMALTCEIVERLIARGLIDEWHVWDFTRDEADRRWLLERYPSVWFVPDDLRYVRIGKSDSGDRFGLRARARNDLHLGLRSLGDRSRSVEIVIGGWGNTHSAVRICDGEALFDHERASGGEEIRRCSSPGVLSSMRFRLVEVLVGLGGLLRVQVDGRALLEVALGGAFGGFEVFAKAGFGSDAELRPDGGGPGRVGVFVGSRAVRPIYHQAYWFYAKREHDYQGCVFVKCDDDIVYVDEERLEDLLRFRVRRPEYFIVSANVVNNGACALFQQRDGAIPADLPGFEGAPGQFLIPLFRSAAMTATLHDHFLGHPDAFRRSVEEVVEWRERLSINFIAWLGEDLQYLHFSQGDDEEIVSRLIPQMLERPCAIFLGCVVAHLSFAPQEAGLDTKRLIGRYRAFAGSVSRDDGDHPVAERGEPVFHGGAPGMA